MRARGLVIIFVAMMWMGRGVSAQQFGAAETFKLRGQVVNTVTGEPVGGALVELVGGARRAQFSSADGSFEFGELMRGSYMVNARKPGYFSDRDLPGGPGGFQVSLPVPSNDDALLKLTPEGVISGRVEDEKGRPLEDIRVEAEMWMVVEGRRQLQSEPEGTVQTDDEGNFRIAALSPGDYYLKFLEPGGGRMIFR